MMPWIDAYVSVYHMFHGYYRNGTDANGRFLYFVIYGLPDTQDANIGKLYINLKLTPSSIQFCS